MSSARRRWLRAFFLFGSSLAGLRSVGWLDPHSAPRPDRIIGSELYRSRGNMAVVLEIYLPLGGAR